MANNTAAWLSQLGLVERILRLWIFRILKTLRVFCLAGKVGTINEKVVVVAAYLPPNYSHHRAEACLDYISDVISEAKRKFGFPFIVVEGDWNQWPLEYVGQEHPELVQVDHDPTRKDKKIDRFLTNFDRAIVASDTLAPLDYGEGRQSNHLMAFFKAAIPIRIAPEEIPTNYSSPLPILTMEQVAKRLQSIKKPESMIKHDVFPVLVGPAAQCLAAPL